MFKKNYIDYVIESETARDEDKSFEEEFVNVTHSEKIILLFLYKKSRATMGQVGEKINMSKSATNFVVGKIVKQGLIEKVRSEEDNRVVYATLTDQGREYVEKLVDILSNRFTKYVSNYLSSVKSDVDEKDQEAIERVIEILKNE